MGWRLAAIVPVLMLACGVVWPHDPWPDEDELYRWEGLINSTSDLGGPATTWVNTNFAGVAGSWNRLVPDGADVLIAGTTDYNGYWDVLSRPGVGVVEIDMAWTSSQTGTLKVIRTPMLETWPE